MHFHAPAAIVALEGRGGGVVRRQAFVQQGGDAFRPRFVGDSAGENRGGGSREKNGSDPARRDATSSF